MRILGVSIWTIAIAGVFYWLGTRNAFAKVAATVTGG